MLNQELSEIEVEELTTIGNMKITEITKDYDREQIIVNYNIYHAHFKTGEAKVIYSFDSKEIEIGKVNKIFLKFQKIDAPYELPTESIEEIKDATQIFFDHLNVEILSILDQMTAFSFNATTLIQECGFKTLKETYRSGGDIDIA